MQWYNESMSDPWNVRALLPVVVLVALVALRRSSTTVDETTLTEWAQARGLQLTADNRPAVASYLRRARQLRAWGAVAGLLLPTLIELALGGPLRVLGFGTDGSGSPGAVVFILIGYLVGAFYADVTLVRRGGYQRRSASLVPRDFGDYLPARLIWLQRGLAGAALIGIALASVIEAFGWGRAEKLSFPGPTGVVLWVGIVIAFTVGLETLQRWLVRRPQPFVSPSLMAADDAIRSQSVHSLAGSGVAVLLLQCGFELMALGAYGGPVLVWGLGIGGLGVCLTSFVALQHYGHHPWRVARLGSGSAGSARTTPA